ncbi:MAG: DUF975 family protein [Spirochaetaceae bacterium]|nr:DUF975 family protein [Spirochaetaceae bacterium]
MVHLSFIGWGLLCCLSFGIGFLWLVPYISMSITNFYEELRKKESCVLNNVIELFGN